MTLRDRARSLWQVRRVLWLLIVRDLKVRYAGSVLGYMWTVLDPLLMSAVYWFVFTVVLKSKSAGHQPYALFLVVGLMAWQWFSATLTDSSRALLTEGKLVRSTALPREVWVLRVVGSKGVEYAFSLPVIAVFMLAYRHPPAWEIVLFPVAMLIQTVLLVGISLALAATTVLVRDLQRVVRIVLRILFYLSPVVYALSRVPNHHHIRDLLILNPMTGIIDLYRAMVFPDQFAGWTQVGAAAAVSLVWLFVGWAVFRRLEGAVLKEI